jgi:hypothetical protein
MKPITLPTSKMAAYLGISKDFLLNNKGKLFIEGIKEMIDVLEKDFFKER